MTNNNLRINRNYGYDILINTFEPFLRKYIVNEVFLVNYGYEWKKHIPKGVLNELSNTKDGLIPEDCTIDDFFDEFTFLNLKDIFSASNNQLSLMKGRTVSCILVNSQEKKDTLIADNIVFDEGV